MFVKWQDHVYDFEIMIWNHVSDSSKSNPPLENGVKVIKMRPVLSFSMQVSLIQKISHILVYDLNKRSKGHPGHENLNMSEACQPCKLDEYPAYLLFSKRNKM